MGRGAGLAFHLLLDGSPPTLSLACGAAPIPNPPPPFLVLRRLQKQLLMKTELAPGRQNATGTWIVHGVHSNILLGI